jgi:hypothetical protein
MPASMTSEIHIDATPDRVFAAMIDSDGYQHWMNGFVGVEKLTQGPLAWAPSGARRAGCSDGRPARCSR